MDRIRIYSKLIEENYKASSVRFNRRLIGFKMWRLSNKISAKIRKDNVKYEKMIEDLRNKNEKDKEDILAEMVQIQRKKLYIFILIIEWTRTKLKNTLRSLG